jgi:HEAT repeat protein
LAAVEALAQASGESASLLLRAAADSDSEVRAAAAWSLAMTDEDGGLGNELLTRLKSESVPTVRSGLYQALVTQQSFDFASVMPVILREENTETRLAGFGLWAAAVRNDDSGLLARQFDLQAVPELAERALTSPQTHESLSAVIALRRSKTEAAKSALREIAMHSGDGKVVEAAQAALKAPVP